MQLPRTLVLLAACGGLIAVSSCEQKREPAVRAPKTEPAAASPPADAPPVASSGSPARPPLFDGWPKPSLALVLTGQLLGYIEPCGCAGLENQKGGLARRHTLIRQLMTERGWPVLPLDVGSQVKRFGKQQEVKFEYVIKGLRAMDYGAVALGDADLGLSPGSLLASIAGDQPTASDVISANVAVLARDLQPRFIVQKVGGKRIGITAVLGAKFEQRLRGDELIHEPALPVLKNVAAELAEKKCDLYVLLAHAPLESARDLAKEAPLFDLIVASGETAVPSYELETVAGTKTRILQVGLKAMHAGVVGVYDDPESPFRYESVPLDARFSDSPEMLKLLADYQDTLRQLGLEELGIKPQPHPSGRMFVGSEKCGECHSRAYEKWSTTPHAHATDSIVMPPNSRGAIARHFDPECLSCHVTGWEAQRYFPYQSGYLSLERSPLLKHNGCENCHGPGSAHVAAESGAVNLSEQEMASLRDAMKLPLADRVAELKCLECHDDDNSPDFHKPGAFDRFWKEVEHRGKD